METFGERLRGARYTAGLSAAELGAVAHLGEGAVFHHETGRSSPSLGQIVNYARALNVTPGWLAFGEGSGRVPEAPSVPDAFDCMAGAV